MITRNNKKAAVVGKTSSRSALRRTPVAAVVKKEYPETLREFIGKAWVNVVKNGSMKGVEFLNITLDRDISEVVLAQGIQIQLWPNIKREGKNDADFRLSIVTPVEEGVAA